jgi:hypothetical protein
VLTAPAFAAGPESWVPARWQGGPLEVQRRTRNNTLPDAPALRETIRQWYDPATLDLLQGTSINCLLVTWSAGGDAGIEKEQQKLVTAYARAARARGIAVLGLIHSPADPSSFLEPALDAGLNGLVLEGAGPDSDRLESALRKTLQKGANAPVVFSAAARAQLAPSAAVLATTDAVPPGVRELADDAEAGPSSEPWIDSNLWLVRSVHSSGGDRPVWLMETLPADAAPVDYLRAIADAAAGGGRWAIALSDELRHGLRAKQADAIAIWRQMDAFLKFQHEHAEWYGYPALPIYGFVQDSSGKARDVSGEHLNLAIRQRLSLRVIERAQLGAAALDGLRAVHAIDVDQPTAAERTLLTEFARAGGLLVVGPSWQPGGNPETEGYATVPTGEGQVVIYRDDADPGELAKSLVELLGRENLGVRLFRASAVLSHSAVADARKAIVVHLLNYASYPAEAVLIRVDGDFRRARLYTPEGTPQELTVEKSGGRVEVTVGRLPVYGVVLFEQ